ncbi:MAG: hypothetical protein ACE5D6_03130 [Candidatus Zixiibacteriota bacterium]
MMKIRLLLLLFLILIFSILHWGCTQPDDVLTPITKTNIWLDEEKLPDNPEGMIYELWLGNIVVNDTISYSSLVSVGKFAYNNELREFYNSNMEKKPDSNYFFLNHDISDFSAIFVSIETIPDNNLSYPGPIMLIADITPDNEINMVFPMVDTMWEGTIRYNMESASDGRDPITDGHSIWFSSYTEISRDFNDTLSINSWQVDVTATETLIVIDTNIIGIDTNSIVVKDTSFVLGLDTVTQTVVRFDIIERIDTLPPYPKTKLIIDYDLIVGAITYDNFTQDEFGFPNLKPYGWKYKGWVVSDVIPKSVLGEMTLPSWMIIGNELDETDGGLLTTGTFDDITAPDDANPYIGSSRIPPFPGEDFLFNLPAGLTDVNLVPNESGGNGGRVFITVEPINFTTDTTNFPLIAFLGKLPQKRSMVTDSLVQQFTLRGWMQSNDQFRGFPKIKVTFERF